MNEGMNDKTKTSREANRSAAASKSQKGTTINDDTASSTANQSVTQQAVVFFVRMRNKNGKKNVMNVFYFAP